MKINWPNFSRMMSENFDIDHSEFWKDKQPMNTNNNHMEHAITKPPIGLKPKRIIDKERLNEVRGAMVRYYNADLKIPIEWVEEYNELIDSTKV